MAFFSCNKPYLSIDRWKSLLATTQLTLYAQDPRPCCLLHTHFKVPIVCVVSIYLMTYVLFADIAHLINTCNKTYFVRWRLKVFVYQIINEKLFRLICKVDRNVQIRTHVWNPRNLVQSMQLVEKRGNVNINGKSHV